MMKVFIGGSRYVSRLSADVRRRLDNIVEKRLPVLVGDANGADKAVQRYLQSKHYDLVAVFCAGESAGTVSADGRCARSQSTGSARTSASTPARTGRWPTRRRAGS